MRIEINGADYKEAFSSAQELIKSGLVRGALECAVLSDGSIKHGEDVFVYVEQIQEFEASQSRMTMTSEGASWFESFRRRARGEATELEEDGTQKWKQFITALADAYHKKYFLSAFRKTNDGDGKAQLDEYQSFAQNIMTTLFDITPVTLAPVSERDIDDEDIYGLSLCLQIGNGMGELIPVLGTVYIKRYGRDFTLMTGFEAEALEHSLELTDDDALSEEEVVDSALVSALLDAFEHYTKDEDNHLAESLYFTEAVDHDAVKTCLDATAIANMNLQCRSVQILGISNIKWKPHAYDVYDGPERIFRIHSSISGGITLFCLGCDAKEPIIDNNILVYIDKNGKRRDITVHPEEAGLGIDSSTLDAIRASDVIASHYIPVGSYCKQKVRGGLCTKKRCRKNLIELAINGEDEKAFFCADCPNPEIVYTDKTGTRFTRLLTYVPTEGAMVPSAETKLCTSCERPFRSDGKATMCSFCSKFNHDEAVENYKKYREILPVTLRLFSGKGEKLCLEDDEILLFRLGDNKYIFHKFSLRERGYIQNPKKTTKS